MMPDFIVFMVGVACGMLIEIILYIFINGLEREEDE